MIFDWDDAVVFGSPVVLLDWEVGFTVYVPPTVSGKTIAGQPRIVYFGEVDADAPTVFVQSSGLHITFHNGTELTYHNGSNIDFHLPANPETPDITGEHPRIVYYGEADL